MPYKQPEQVLVIACGALAREIQQLKQLNAWDHLNIQCLDASLHNQPQLLPPLIKEKIKLNRADYDRIFVAYADCGTVGAIDKVLQKEGIERLPGAHCYAAFIGLDNFEQLQQEQPATFYLTDFLAQHFERLVIKTLKLDQFPELKDSFFANYQRLVYLSQQQNPRLLQLAKQAAEQLSLDFEHIHTGYGLLQSTLKAQVEFNHA